MLFTSTAALFLLATTVSAENRLFASYNGTATTNNSCKQLSKEAYKECEKNFPRFAPNSIMLGHCGNGLAKYDKVCEEAQKPFAYAFKFPPRPLKTPPVAYVKGLVQSPDDCGIFTQKSNDLCVKLYPYKFADDEPVGLFNPTQGICLAAAAVHRDACFRSLVSGKKLPATYEFLFPHTFAIPAMATASPSIVTQSHATATIAIGLPSAVTTRPPPTGTEEPVIEDPVTEEPVPTAASTIRPPPTLPTGVVGPVSVAMKVEGKASNYEECGRFQDQSVKKCTLGFPRWSPTGGAESGKCITAASSKADECRKAIDKKKAFDFEFIYPAGAASTKGRSASFAGLEVDGDDEITREGPDGPDYSTNFHSFRSSEFETDGDDEITREGPDYSTNFHSFRSAEFETDGDDEITREGPDSTFFHSFFADDEGTTEDPDSPFFHSF
ncbi:hypothetical protein HDU96_007237 [Phlyctochytrium bullatum]|nr:hypothetical protein HDU96_007237 [Phlyctochytrium bullatum]